VLARLPLAVAAVALVATFSAELARADDGSPVILVAHGPNAILVEVASGVTMPCDASTNRPLYRGALAPGGVLHLSSPSASICFRQTYDDFPEANWSTPRLLGPLPLCSATRRRAGACTHVPDPTIRVEVHSAEPRR
jgi:hypothetical protein